MKPPPLLLYRDLVTRALAEDLEHGDVTTASTVDTEAPGAATIVAKEETVIAGLFVVQETFRQLDPDIRFSQTADEGAVMHPEATLLRMEGRLASILHGERVALNFLQRLCGIATLARQFVATVAGLPVRIVDTRKTTPGLRLLQKYAVRVGGAHNHRFSLADGVLIKDNHIAACGSIATAMARAQRAVPHAMRIQIEVRTQAELREAIEAGADVLLLDNMDPDTLRAAVNLARELRPSILLEASGGVTLANVRAVAETGVDLISSGALTHSAPARDLSLRIEIDSRTTSGN